MVKLQTSLLALTFVTGLVLASSSDYQRRDYELFDRDIDTFDELEARSLFGGLLKIGEEVGEKAFKGKVGKIVKTAAKAEHRGGSARKIEKKVDAYKKDSKTAETFEKEDSERVETWS